MNPFHDHQLNLTRRQLFGRTALGLGTAAMAQMLGPDLLAAPGRATIQAWLRSTKDSPPASPELATGTLPGLGMRSAIVAETNRLLR